MSQPQLPLGLAEPDGPTLAEAVELAQRFYRLLERAYPRQRWLYEYAWQHPWLMAGRPLPAKECLCCTPYEGNLWFLKGDE